MSVEVSFILPCLNEAATVERCIRSAQRCIEHHGLAAEIIVADNGSHDGSQAIAARAGALVVPVGERGYGNALIGGFEAARGRWLIMGDADESYDFAEAMPMVEALRAGADLVMGSRFKGRIEPGAMPFLHRWLGNPVLSLIGRLLFHAPVSDFHCGMRGLSQEAFRKLGLRTGGMEIASEMVVKAATRKMRIVEVPITLHRDGRGRPPHLRTWRDGWRHLRFMVVLSPRFALLLPGLALMGIGAIALVSLAGGVREWRGVSFGVHTMVVASLLVIVGYQAVTTAIAARIFAVSEEIGPPAPWMQRAFDIFTLERGLLAGALLATLGLAGIALPAWRWAEAGFPPLDPVLTLRPVILGATIAAVGIQTLLMSIVYSMLGISRRRGG